MNSMLFTNGRNVYDIAMDAHTMTDDRKNYIYFLAAVLTFGIAAASFKGVQDNYLAEVLLVSKVGRGAVEFFRELPGLFLLLILALFYKIPEHIILRIGYAVAMIGAAAFVLVGERLIPAVAFLTLWSMGEHIIMPIKQSFAIHSAAFGSEGSALGKMRGIESLGKVIGFFIVPAIFAVAAGRAGYSATFSAVILLAGLSMLLTFKLRGDGLKVKRQRLYFHRKYKIYYILQNFYGARKQVFLTFGPYVLILNYGASPSVIATLMGVSAILNIFGSPLIGRIIDKAGYKAVMVGDTIILFFVCLLYGFAHRLFPMNTAFFVICAVYVLDNLISHASIAASIYVKQLSDDREEMTATLTTGISLDHLISIFIALAGGMIWEFLGLELLFSLAAAMAAANSLVALTIKSKKALQDNQDDLQRP